MLKFHQSLLVTLAMGVLLMQMSPAFSRRSRSSNTRTTEASDTATDTEVTATEEPENCIAQIDTVALANFSLQAFFDFLILTLSAIALCPPVCSNNETCVDCFRTVLDPVPRLLPANVIDTTCFTL